jgi:hypothetical protein
VLIHSTLLRRSHTIGQSSNYVRCFVSPDSSHSRSTSIGKEAPVTTRCLSSSPDSQQWEPGGFIQAFAIPEHSTHGLAMLGSVDFGY